MSFGFSRGKYTIMITTARSITAAVLVAAIALPAHAQSVSDRPDMSLTQISERLSERGFRVLEIERDDGHYEVKAFNRSGQCVEVDVNRSGGILRIERDDDCNESDSHRRGGNRAR